MSGKLIVIEAGDGSGKATQTEKLYLRLKRDGYRVRKIEFPDYESESAALIKMYLRGDFGCDPDAVNPYVASTFYAVNRYVSYNKDWKQFLQEGGIVIADRYTTSNMVHQAGKIADEQERESFLDWLWDFEFSKFKLPPPDQVFFLNMPPAYTRELMRQRVNKFTGKEEKDIHERNYSHLVRSYQNACLLADRYGWEIIDCLEGDRLKTVAEIHEEIYVRVLLLL